jgi:hypothetical protein
MRKRLSRRFFFCVHECSPSMSAIARGRLFGLDGGGRGRNVKPISGRGSTLNAKVSCGDAGIVKLKNTDAVGIDNWCSVWARIIPRCPASCDVLERGRRSACSYGTAVAALVGNVWIWKCCVAVWYLEAREGCGYEAKFTERSGAQLVLTVDQALAWVKSIQCREPKASRDHTRRPNSGVNGWVLPDWTVGCDVGIHGSNGRQKMMESKLSNALKLRVKRGA